LNYKVNVNKLHFKADWKYFLGWHFTFQNTSSIKSRRKTACNKSIAARPL